MDTYDPEVQFVTRLLYKIRDRVGQEELHKFVAEKGGSIGPRGSALLSLKAYRAFGVPNGYIGIAHPSKFKGDKK